MIGRVIVLTFVVGFFGVASAVLGFIAEASRLKRDDIRVSDGECVYPANAAFALGLCAVALLLVAQITISVLTGCCGCCHPRGGFSSSRCRRFIGIVCAVLSWIAAVLAVLFFLLASAGNVPVTRGNGSNCYYVTAGVFRRAAVLSLVSTALGIFAYIMLRAGHRTTAAGGHNHNKPYYGQQPQAGGLPMGQPQGYGQAPYQNMPPAQGQGYGQGQYPPAAGPAAV